MNETLVIPSDVDRIDEARRWLAGHAEGVLDTESIQEFELALTEALSNVIRHSYDGDPDQRVEISVAADEQALTVTVADHGRGFDPAMYIEPSLEEAAEGGYGVYLMEELMDDVRRERSPDGTNTLTLVKARKSA